MPVLGTSSIRKLIQYLCEIGFEGPYSGGNHQFMMRGKLRWLIPNPHNGKISGSLLSKIVKQAEILHEELEKL